MAACWDTAISKAVIPDLVRALLKEIEPNDREGLVETPDRVAKAYSTWFGGYDVDPGSLLKTFQDGAEGVDEMVLETGIPVYSHCEHHMASIFGVAHVAYIPNKRVVGLSKISRVVDAFARRLQVQERLTNQIANCLNENLKPLGVGVMLECRHLCMESRGINRSGIITTTSALRGCIKKEAAARHEFLTLIQRAKT